MGLEDFLCVSALLDQLQDYLFCDVKYKYMC